MPTNKLVDLPLTAPSPMGQEIIMTTVIPQQQSESFSKTACSRVECMLFRPVFFFCEIVRQIALVASVLRSSHAARKSITCSFLGLAFRYALGSLFSSKQKRLSRLLWDSSAGLKILSLTYHKDKLHCEKFDLI